MRAGIALLSCLALATNASAQVRIVDAPVDLAGPPADSLVVSGDPPSCVVPSTVSLAAISEKGSSTEIASRRTGVCRWVVRGLEAGAYEIGLTHAHGSGGRTRFDYVPGQTTEVRIPEPTVKVTGVVQINGAPVPGAQIMFTTRPVQSGLPKVVTDQDGFFEAMLPEAGPVSLRLSGNDVYSQGVGAVFNEGPNRFDWTITGGTVVGASVSRRPGAARNAIWHAQDCNQARPGC